MIKVEFKDKICIKGNKEREILYDFDMFIWGIFVGFVERINWS